MRYLPTFFTIYLCAMLILLCDLSLPGCEIDYGLMGDFRQESSPGQYKSDDDCRYKPSTCR